ncbi:helix-turn-helix transcriptional regulator [Methylohalomonas lacus]|uniref:helix-turn-helix transcriptional regulator n=1 Tax=Methylohalomonas lacus TaxID=398773 RepID=UPI002169C65B|nr:AlpA family transcriptional regulator [Methylohalomonas lacus]
MASERLIRRPEVLKITGLSRSSLYERISEGAFPSPIRIGPNRVAWIASEVDQWVQDRIQESRSDAA